MLKFEECVKECLENDEFVVEFNRLFGTSLFAKPNIMNLLVDKATGYDKAEGRKDPDLEKFVAFVYETVWCRLPDGAKDPTQVVSPPPGRSFEELLGIG